MMSGTNVYFRLEGVLPRREYENALAQWASEGFLGSQECEEHDGLLRFSVFFSSKTVADSIAESLNSSTRNKGLFRVCAIPQEDWNAKWRESMEPALLAPSWWVAPEWLPPACREGDHWIKIEPKMAFGTGHHETTRLAAGAMIENADMVSGAPVLDVGTGSGVLCFVAARLGAALSCGVEIDPDCRENLAENRDVNGMSPVPLFCIGGIESIRSEIEFAVIIMNMIFTESAPLLRQCVALLQPGGLLIWSGILDDDHRQAVVAAEDVGLTKIANSVENEWWCGIFTSPRK